jgi:hypothetical protein
MLHPEEPMRAQQIPILAHQLGQDRADQILALFESVKRLGVSMRLPLLELALPVIKSRPAGQLEFMNDLLETLAQQNNYLELFEYTLLRIYQNYIRAAQQPAARVRWRNLDDPEVQKAAVTLLRIYAELGHHDSAVAAAAMEAGLLRLGLAAEAQPLPEHWALEADAALESLRCCIPKDREIVIKSLIAAALHDQHISAAESELLRAFCAVLECPMPPILAAH